MRLALPPTAKGPRPLLLIVRDHPSTLAHLYQGPMLFSFFSLLHNPTIQRPVFFRLATQSSNTGQSRWLGKLSDSISRSSTCADPRTRSLTHSRAARITCPGQRAHVLQAEDYFAKLEQILGITAAQGDKSRLLSAVKALSDSR